MQCMNLSIIHRGGGARAPLMDAPPLHPQSPQILTDSMQGFFSPLSRCHFWNWRGCTGFCPCSCIIHLHRSVNAWTTSPIFHRRHDCSPLTLHLSNWKPIPRHRQGAGGRVCRILALHSLRLWAQSFAGSWFKKKTNALFFFSAKWGEEKLAKANNKQIQRLTPNKVHKQKINYIRAFTVQ